MTKIRIFITRDEVEQFRTVYPSSSIGSYPIYYTLENYGKYLVSGTCSDNNQTVYLMGTNNLLQVGNAVEVERDKLNNCVKSSVGYTRHYHESYSHTSYYGGRNHYSVRYRPKQDYSNLSSNYRDVANLGDYRIISNSQYQKDAIEEIKDYWKKSVDKEDLINGKNESALLGANWETNIKSKSALVVGNKLAIEEERKRLLGLITQELKEDFNNTLNLKEDTFLDQKTKLEKLRELKTKYNCKDEEEKKLETIIEQLEEKIQAEWTTFFTKHNITDTDEQDQWKNSNFTPTESQTIYENGWTSLTELTNPTTVKPTTYTYQGIEEINPLIHQKESVDLALKLQQQIENAIYTTDLPEIKDLNNALLPLSLQTKKLQELKTDKEKEFNTEELVKQRKEAVEKLKNYWTEANLGTEEQRDKILGNNWEQEIDKQTTVENIQEQLNRFTSIINVVKEIVKDKEEELNNSLTAKDQSIADLKKERDDYKDKFEKEEKDHETTKQNLPLTDNGSLEALEKDWIEKAHNSLFYPPFYEKLEPKVFTILIRKEYRTEKGKDIKSLLTSLTVEQKLQAEPIIKAVMISYSLERSLKDFYWQKDEKIKEHQRNIEYLIHVLTDTLNWDEIKGIVKNNPLYLARLDKLETWMNEVQEKLDNSYNSQIEIPPK